MTYFSTFITGFGEVVKKALLDNLPDIKVIQLLDGVVVFETMALPDQVKKLGFLNNSFILIQKFTSASLQSMVQAVLDDPLLEEKLLPVLPKSAANFRIVTSRENEFIPLSPNLIHNLEQQIVQVTHLYVNRSNPDFELWFYQRRESLGFFGLRITRHTAYDKILERGELRPELANLLILLSNPKPDDIFLDPFSGSGAIPISRAKLMPAKKILAGDIKPEVVNKLRRKTQKPNLKIIMGRWDALNLRTFTDTSVDKIVTDPPWGVTVGKHLDLNKFYYQMLSEFNRVLTVGGIIVLLVARKELLEKALEKFENLALLEKYDILVNGQKAGVYVLKKVQSH